MQVIREGHRYELSNFENNLAWQQLQFIEKEPNPDVSGAMITVNDGTTNEEVLAMLIDRMRYLQVKFCCRENAIVITKLEEALMWLEMRTNDRKKRGVEGQAIK